MRRPCLHDWQVVAAWPADASLQAAHLAQHAVFQLGAQLQGCVLAHRGQPVVDHGLPGPLAGEINQNPLLQATQHGTVQLPEITSETGAGWGSKLTS